MKGFRGRQQAGLPSKASGILAALALAAAGVLGAPSAAKAAECENPEALRFSIIPTEETIQELTLYKPVIELLSKNTGKKIEFYMPTSYASVVEAMIGGWVDVGVHGPNSYVLAHEKDPSIEVFATYAKRPGYLQEEGPGYRAALITRKDSQFDSVESLRGTTIALTDPASTSGNLIPRVLFRKEVGTELEDYFSKVVYTGEHDKSTIAVHENKVDAAFVATHRFDNVVERGFVKLEDFNVLWQSPPVPQDPFTYRGKLCDDLKASIKNTFLTLQDHPEAKQFLDNVKANKFVEMQDSDYDIIRELRKAKEEM
ncbi:MAG: phosphate/phosphite/phosphonate ABC transporter substrate-binding protein [Kiloniellales bacterium]